jgi:archaellum component FlaC
MSSFKNRVKKVKKMIKQPITLDHKHKQIIDKFHEDNNNLENYYNELEKFKNNLNSIDDKSDSNIKKKILLKEKIKNIELKINDIENNNEELDYYLQTISILDNYYTNKPINVEEENNNILS